MVSYSKLAFFRCPTANFAKKKAKVCNLLAKKIPAALRPNHLTRVPAPRHLNCRACHPYPRCIPNGNTRLSLSLSLSPPSLPSLSLLNSPFHQRTHQPAIPSQNQIPRRRERNPILRIVSQSRAPVSSRSDPASVFFFIFFALYLVIQRASERASEAMIFGVFFGWGAWSSWMGSTAFVVASSLVVVRRMRLRLLFVCCGWSRWTRRRAHDAMVFWCVGIWFRDAAMLLLLGWGDHSICVAIGFCVFFFGLCMRCFIMQACGCLLPPIPWSIS